jgi:nucleoside-diphosphate-sugar epimerase
MKIAITGVTGFVGSNLFKYLLNHSYELKALNLRNSNWKSEIDLNTTAIVHLAGKAHDMKNSSNIEEYFEINTKITKKLFDIFLASNCRDFIFFSSVKAVTDQTEDVVTEETVTNPQTVYGQSKLKAEQYILSKKMAQDKRVFIIRPSMIHGPGNKGNLNLLYQIVAKRIPWPLGVFENQRSFCSIDNVCFVINEILENKNITSGIYNLADDRAISTNLLIEFIAISQNKEATIYKIPKKLIVTLAKFGDYFRLPLNSERLQKLTESYVVSNEKIVKAIGKPLPVSTEEGLIQTLKSFNKI